jgi:hypothetical protein
LIVEDNLPKNSLSFFVSSCLKELHRELKEPLCIISYSDPNAGHHGYIYQATNWLYTGESNPKKKYVFESGEEFDVQRGLKEKERL